MSALSSENGAKPCLEKLYVGHIKEEGELGYKPAWYDQIGDEGEETAFYFTPPRAVGDLYFTVETYPFDVVPVECTRTAINTPTGTQIVLSPVVEFGLYIGSLLISQTFYVDSNHQPILLT